LHDCDGDGIVDKNEVPNFFPELSQMTCLELSAMEKEITEENKKVVIPKDAIKKLNETGEIPILVEVNGEVEMVILDISLINAEGNNKKIYTTNEGHQFKKECASIQIKNISVQNGKLHLKLSDEKNTKLIINPYTGKIDDNKNYKVNYDAMESRITILNKNDSYNVAEEFANKEAQFSIDQTKNILYDKKLIHKKILKITKNIDLQIGHIKKEELYPVEKEFSSNIKNKNGENIAEIKFKLEYVSHDLRASVLINQMKENYLLRDINLIMKKINLKK